MDQSLALAGIVALPLAGAIANGLIGLFGDKPLPKTDRMLVKGIGIGSVALAFVLGVYSFWQMTHLPVPAGEQAGAEHAGAIGFHAWEWFSITIGDGIRIPINVSFVMDHLSGVMTLVVTGIGLLIHLYSAGYMDEEPAIARFFAYLNLFTAAMLILVLASNFPLLFVGWEGVGLCSYLLIGFWYENGTYAAAGKKAFIVNRIGDFGVLIGMFLLVATLHTFDFKEIAERAADPATPLMGMVKIARATWPITIATFACLFIFLGCAGKSAQIPLFVWLPDAMAGPTPVSALIHAATMVTAGVYLCCRLSNVFVLSPTAMSVIAIVGTLTAFMAATIGLVQNQLKKVLAYSTVSQLGFMFAAVGVGAFGAGIFHVFTHAFFKACLFLGAGAVMHAVHAHGDADVRRLGGLRKYLPRTHLTFLLSCCAIAGVPLFSGFFSKDAILDGALGAGGFLPTWVGYAVFGMLVATAAMTAFYMFRLYFLTFWGEERWAKPPEGEAHAADAHAHAGQGPWRDPAAEAGEAQAAAQAAPVHDAVPTPHEAPDTMTIPLIVLAAGAVLAGFLGMPEWLHEYLHVPNLWEQFLEPVLAAKPAVEGAHGMSHALVGAIAMGAGLTAGLGGIYAAYYVYVQQKGEPAKRMASSAYWLYKFLLDKWRVDELYEATVIRAMHGLAAFSALVDRIVVDGVLTKVTAGLVKALGWLFTRTQTGVVYAYGLVIVVGLAVFAWWFAVPRADLQATPGPDGVKWTTVAGRGYEVRWDADSDGEFEGEWSADAIEHDMTYDDHDYRGAVLTFEGPPGMVRAEGEEPETLTVTEGDFVELDTADLGSRWHKANADDRPPAVAWVEGHEERARGREPVWVPGFLRLRPNDAVVAVDGHEVTEAVVKVQPGQTIRFGANAEGDEMVIGATTNVGVSALVRGVVQVRNAFGYVRSEERDVALDVSGGAHGERAEAPAGGAP